MPNPLEALRKAQTVQNADSPDPLDKGGWFDNAVQGLKGLVGLGDDIPSSQGWNANHIGQMLGAVAPLGGPLRRVIGEVPEGTHPAVSALLGMLGKAAEVSPEAEIPNFRDTKVGGYYVPRRALTIAPEGFEFPADMGTDQFMSRDPTLVDKWIGQQNAYTGKTSGDIRPIVTNRGGKNAVRSYTNRTFVSKGNPDREKGFDSKFSIAGLPDISLANPKGGSHR